MRFTTQQASFIVAGCMALPRACRLARTLGMRFNSQRTRPVLAYGLRMYEARPVYHEEPKAAEEKRK